MSAVDLTKKTVLEIGAADIRHQKFWNNFPSKYIIIDVSKDLINIALSKLATLGVASEHFCIDGSNKLPLNDNSVDVVISFYSLEHIYPLEPFILELKRVLRPEGIFIGAFPTEGGLAWGFSLLEEIHRGGVHNIQILMRDLLEESLRTSSAKILGGQGHCDPLMVFDKSFG